ncbi:hypothetical protein ACFY3N_23965 [Streptomyces sp. NPDC000348]|uniref:hypothetical protein n=1 Tax=Streptomyces sp. NPDC000348 TaxID=3364538 RepID=UPI00368B04FB
MAVAPSSPPPDSSPSRRSPRPPAAVPGRDEADGKPGATASRAADGDGGEVKIPSDTSIGPMDNTWPAGPRLGEDAEALYRNMSETYGGR